MRKLVLACVTTALVFLTGCMTSEDRPVRVTVQGNFGGSSIAIYTQKQADYSIEETDTEYTVTVTMPKPIN